MSLQLSSVRWAAVTSLILLAGCSGGSAGTATGPLEQTTITVDAFGAIDTAGLFIAQQDGLFARQGLTVRLRPQFLIQPQVDDLLQGKADIASGDYVTFIENQTGGDPDLGGRKPDLRIVSESSFLQPNVLELVTTPRSPITSVAALKGKSISVLGPKNVGDILVDSLLQTHGIPVGKVRFPSVPFPAIGTAFKQRKMDAAFAPEPFVTFLAEGAGVEELADLDQGATENFPIQGMVTTGSWARSHPNTLRAFLTAYNQGQGIAATDRAQVERALETFLQLTPEVAALVSLPAFPQGVNPIRLQRTVSAMLQFGMLSQQFRHFDIRTMIGA